MKDENIKFLFKMTKSFLDGEIDVITYTLDFPHEVETRYKKLVKEDRDIAELIFDCLVEGGVYKYDDLSDEEFMDEIAYQYDFVLDVYKNGKY